MHRTNVSTLLFGLKGWKFEWHDHMTLLLSHSGDLIIESLFFSQVLKSRNEKETFVFRHGVTESTVLQFLREGKQMK